MAEMTTLTLTAEQLLGARRATEVLLDELGLRNYRFDVEPREGAFDVMVEHEREGSWHAVTMHEDASVLLAAREDARVRAQVAARWRERIGGGGARSYA